MIKSLFACAASIAVLTSGAVAAPTATPVRPAADLARDAQRKPLAMLAFAGVRKGDTVIEMVPGGGYFTRELSIAVGPTGHVYAAVPEPKPGDPPSPVSVIAAQPGYGNVTVIPATGPGLIAAPQADFVWTAQNYHDFHLSRIRLDVPSFDKLLLSKLRHGGKLVVIDHVALPGAPVTETADTLHRIDPAAARAEITAAGFLFEAESAVLRNPADPHTAVVYDPSIRGHTDQFVYRFRRP